MTFHSISSTLVDARTLESSLMERCYGSGGQRVFTVLGKKGVNVPGTLIFTQGSVLTIMTPCNEAMSLKKENLPSDVVITTVNDTHYYCEWLTVGDGLHQLGAFTVDNTESFIFVTENGINVTLHVYFFNNNHCFLMNGNFSRVIFEKMVTQSNLCKVEAADMCFNRDNNMLAILAGPPSCSLIIFKVELLMKRNVFGELDVLKDDYAFTESASNSFSGGSDTVNDLALNETEVSFRFSTKSGVQLTHLTFQEKSGICMANISFSPFSSEILVTSGAEHIVFWTLGMQPGSSYYILTAVEGTILRDGISDKGILQERDLAAPFAAPTATDDYGFSGDDAEKQQQKNHFLGEECRIGGGGVRDKGRIVNYFGGDGGSMRITCHTFMPDGSLVCGVMMVHSKDEIGAAGIMEGGELSKATLSSNKQGPFTASTAGDQTQAVTIPTAQAKTTFSAVYPSSQDSESRIFTGLIRFTDFTTPIGVPVTYVNNNPLATKQNSAKVITDITGSPIDDPIVNDIAFMCLTKTHLITTNAHGTLVFRNIKYPYEQIDNINSNNDSLKASHGSYNQDNNHDNYNINDNEFNQQQQQRPLQEQPEEQTSPFSSKSVTLSSPHSPKQATTRKGNVHFEKKSRSKSPVSSPKSEVETAAAMPPSSMQSGSPLSPSLLYGQQLFIPIRAVQTFTSDTVYMAFNATLGFLIICSARGLIKRVDLNTLITGTDEAEKQKTLGNAKSSHIPKHYNNNNGLVDDRSSPNHQPLSKMIYYDAFISLENVLRLNPTIMIVNMGFGGVPIVGVCHLHPPSPPPEHSLSSSENLNSIPHVIYDALYSPTRIVVVNEIAMAYLIDYSTNTLLGSCFVGGDPLRVEVIGTTNAFIVTSATTHVRVFSIEINDGVSVEDHAYGTPYVEFVLIFKGCFMSADDIEEMVVTRNTPKASLPLPSAIMMPAERPQLQRPSLFVGSNPLLKRAPSTRETGMGRIDSMRRSTSILTSGSFSREVGGDRGNWVTIMRRFVQVFQGIASFSRLTGVPKGTGMQYLSVSPDGSLFVTGDSKRLYFFIVDIPKMIEVTTKRNKDSGASSSTSSFSRKSADIGHLNLRRRSDRLSSAPSPPNPHKGLVKYIGYTDLCMETDVTAISLLPPPITSKVRVPGGASAIEAAEKKDSPSNKLRDLILVTSLNGDTQVVFAPTENEALDNPGENECALIVNMDTQNGNDYSIDVVSLYVNSWHLDTSCYAMLVLNHFSDGITLLGSCVDKDERVYLLDKNLNPERKDRLARPVKALTLIQDHGKCGTGLMLTPPNAEGHRYVVSAARDGKVLIRQAEPYLVRMGPQSTAKEKRNPLLKADGHISLLGGVSGMCCNCLPVMWQTFCNPCVIPGAQKDGSTKHYSSSILSPPLPTRIISCGKDGNIFVWNVDSAIANLNQQGNCAITLQKNYPVLPLTSHRIIEVNNLQKKSRLSEVVCLNAAILNRIPNENIINKVASFEEGNSYPTVTLDIAYLRDGGMTLQKPAADYFKMNLLAAALAQQQQEQRKSASTSILEKRQLNSVSLPTEVIPPSPSDAKLLTDAIATLQFDTSLPFIQRTKAFVDFLQLTVPGVDDPMHYMVKKGLVSLITQKKESKTYRERIYSRILKLREQLKSIRDENELVNEDERVELKDFLMETQQMEFEKKVDSSIAVMREEMELENVRREYIAEMLTKQCWDSMDVKLTPLRGLANQKLEVYNFHTRKSDESQMNLVKKLKFLRLVEIKDRARRNVRELEDIYFENADQVPDELPPDALLLMSKAALEEVQKSPLTSPLGKGKSDQSAISLSPVKRDEGKRVGGEEILLNDQQASNAGKTLGLPLRKKTEAVFVDPSHLVVDLASISLESQQFDDPSFYLYEPLLVFTPHRAIIQEKLLQLLNNMYKHNFNVSFDKLVEQKKSDIHYINERNQACTRLLKELGEDEPMFIAEMCPEETPEKIIFEIDESKLNADKSKDPDEKIRLAQAAVEKQRWLERHGAEDNSDKALKVWMDGRLEKEVKMLKVDVEMPNFADETSEKYVPPADRSEDEHRIFKEYEETFKKLTDEVNARRAQLREDFEKAQKENNATAAAFDTAVSDLLQKRLMAQQECYTIRLARVKLMQRVMLFDVRLKTARKIQQKKKKIEQQLKVAQQKVNIAKQHHQDIKKQCEALQEKVTAEEKGIKQLPFFSHPEYGEVLLALNSKRNKTFLKRKAAELQKQQHQGQASKSGCLSLEEDTQMLHRAIEDNDSQDPFDFLSLYDERKKEKELAERRLVTANAIGATTANTGLKDLRGFDIHDVNLKDFKPRDLDHVPDTIWKAFIDYRIDKFVNDYDLGRLMALAGKTQQSLAQCESRRDFIKSKIDSVSKEFQAYLHDSLIEQYNVDEVYVFKQGQVEVEQAPVVTDYSDAILIHKDNVERLNKMINESSEEKIKFLEENINRSKELAALEWDVEFLIFTRKSLQMQLRHLHTLRVTKQMQEFINGGHAGYNEKQREKLQQKITHLRKVMAGKIEEKRNEISKIRRSIRDKEMENYVMLDQVSEVKSLVNDRRSINDLQNTDSGQIIAAKRMRELRTAKRLQTVIAAQEEDVAALKKALSKWRERTFPSFAVVMKRTMGRNTIVQGQRNERDSSSER